MRRPFLAALTLVGAAAPAVAQEMRHQENHGVAMTSLLPLYQRVKDLYVRSAEAMPEEYYAFRPTTGVRAFAEILGHVANENYLFCAAAKGEKDPNTTDFENTTAKADMIAALNASFAYCDPAYRMPEATAMEETTFFGQKGSKLWVLIFNVTHDSEHYGNIVTYMRMKGLVPPSSQGGI